MKASEDRPGTKKNPIPIKDISEARANVSYVIEKPSVKKREAVDG